MKTLMGTLALVLLLTLPMLTQAQNLGYAYGDTVADFTLRDSQGVDVSLSDYPDKIVLLLFWQID